MSLGDSEFIFSIGFWILDLSIHLFMYFILLNHCHRSRDSLRNPARIEPPPSLQRFNYDGIDDVTDHPPLINTR